MGQSKSKSKNKDRHELPKEYLGLTMDPKPADPPVCKIEPTVVDPAQVREEIYPTPSPRVREDFKTQFYSDNPVVIGKIKSGKEILLVAEGESLSDSRIMYVWYTVISGLDYNYLPDKAR